MRWEPAIYEHKAALVGQSPYAVSRDPLLLARATIAEFEHYRTGAVVVGIDLYNIEAEAMGARVVDLGPQACPDTFSPIWELDSLPQRLPQIDLVRDGRFGTILDAAAGVRDTLGDRANVRVPVSGPLAIAAKCVGLEDVLMEIACGGDAIHKLMEHAASLGERWIARIRQCGFDAVVFDSPAAPPMLSPRLYRDLVKPLHARLMRAMGDQQERPLVIGGDTTAIVADMIDAGANYIVCDFTASASAFAEAITQPVVVRRNADPRLLLGGTISTAASALAYDLACFAHPVAGTGVLPYAMPPQRLAEFRNDLWMHLHEEACS